MVTKYTYPYSVHRVPSNSRLDNQPGAQTAQTYDYNSQQQYTGGGGGEYQQQGGGQAYGAGQQPGAPAGGSNPFFQ